MATTKKNYRIIFWNLFGVGLIANVIMMFIKNYLSNYYGIASLVYLLIFIVLVILWSVNFNQAWKAIGKKFGWLVGLISILPFGFLICICIAYFTLKGTEYWTGEYKSFKLQK